MSQVISGTVSDLPSTDEKIVLEFVKSKYPTSGYTPARDKIKFSTYGFYTKSFSLSFQISEINITDVSHDVKKYSSRILIHVWVQRNTPEQPTELWSIQNKVETIINTNRRNMPYGISSIKVLQEFGEADLGFFSGGGGLATPGEQTVWHNQMMVELVYFKTVIQE